MSNAHISYAPRPDATPESEVEALANVYAYLIKTHDSKMTAKPAQPKTGKEEFHAREGGPMT
jgi:hypothetical protein